MSRCSGNTANSAERSVIIINDCEIIINKIENRI